jgi:AraC-like DNA-binding protein
MGERGWDTRALWDAFGPADPERTGDGASAGSIDATAVGGLGVSRISSQQQSVSRTAVDMGDRAGGGYFLNLLLAGRSSIAQHGRVADLEPGDFALIDSDVPFELNVAGTCRQVSLTIPRELLAPLLAVPADATAVRVRGDSGVGAIASAAIRAVAEHTATLDRRAATAAATHVTNLVALALRGVAGTPRPSHHRRLLLQMATDEIAASYADATLSPAVVAARTAISVRYLHRLFADEGTSFGRALLRQRLEAARQRLEDPDFAQVTVTDVALRAGFSDASHFARAFRAAYGHTPLQHRRGSALTGSVLTGSALSS